jgi:hypothetical protein
MQVYKTGQFTLFFPSGYEERAELLLSELETYKDIPEGIIGNKLADMPLLLEDAGQYSQGIADPVYRRISLFNYDDNEERWFRSVGVHEYTHMLQMLKKSGAPSVLAGIFGDIVSPGIFAPDWMLEGIAVYDESQISRYSGRLNNSELEPFIAALISEGKSPDLVKASYAPFEYPYGNAPYLFGGEFFGYLSKTYGEDKFGKIFESYGASLLSYLTFVLPAIAMDNTFREVYGKSTEELWKEWSLSAKEKYKNYKMEGIKITDRGFYTDSPVIHIGRLYYINNKAVKTGVYDTWGFHNVIECDLRTGEEKEIISRTSHINPGLRFFREKLYFTVEQLGFPYPNRYESGYGFDSVLCEKDMETGKEKELFRDSISSFCPASANTIIYSGNQTYKYGSKIMLYDAATNSKQELFEVPYTITGMSAYRDKNIFIVSARPEKENSGIYELNINDKTMTKIIDTPWTEDAASVYKDRIFYSSNMDGAKRLYCYDTKDKKTYRLTTNGTAHETAFDEINNDIYFVGVDLKGFDIYKKKFRPERIRPEKYAAEEPRPRVLPSFTKGSYLDDLATLYPKIRYPYFDYRNDGAYAAGAGLMGTDAAGDFYYDASVFYDSVSKKAGTIINAGMYFLNPAVISVNYQSLENYFAIGMEGPVYTSLLGGISSIKPALVYAYKGSTGQKQLIPYVTADFLYTLTNGSVFLASYIQQPWLGSNRQVESFKAELDVNQYLGASVMKIRTGFIKSTSETSDLMGDVRGYADKALGKKGIYGSAEIFKPLLELHTGLWNPNIFFQDVVGSVFCDSAFTEMQSQLSYGVALHLETEVFMNVPLDIGVSGQVDKDGKFSSNLIFKVLLNY